MFLRAWKIDRRSSRPVHSTPRRRRSLAAVVPLEARRLLATIVPSGFVDSAYGATISNPTAMDFAPDGRLFVLTQGGTVRVIQPGGTLNTTPALTLAVDSSGERGLLGLAFDPTFDASAEGADYIYLYHTVPAPSGGSAHNQVTRYEVIGDTVQPGTALNILDLDNLSGATNHNGGAMHFGLDGKLYVTVGDNANSANAQSVNNRLGKILRINKDGSIPEDNPATFQVRPTSSTTYNAVTPAGVNRAIWAMGLRNPYTFSVNPISGQIFINDVGEVTWEEINIGVAGANYGWPRTEGDFSTSTSGNQNFTRPLYAYQHGGSYPNGNAISGGAFYTGSTATTQFPPAFQNRYFFGDYVNDWMASIDPTAAPAPNGAPQYASNVNGVVDLKLGPDGALYYVQRESSAGGILSGVRRVSVNGVNAPTITDQPDSASVDQGRSVTFTAAATGNGGALSYQWTRNNVDIPGATGSTYTISAASLADSGAVYRVRVGNSAASTLSAPATLTVVPDATVPNVVSTVFDRDDPQHRITITLSEPLANFTPGAVTVETSANTPVAVGSATYDAETNQIVITPAAQFTTGRYHVVLSGLTDLAGNALAATPLDFAFLVGDANASGTVDFTDLVTLASNYNQPGKTFSQGDFDYSGTVDFADLVLLAQNYNQSLPAIAASSILTATGSTKGATKKRIELE